MPEPSSPEVECQPEIATVAVQTAYRAVCDECGWQGRLRLNPVVANADAQEHKERWTDA